MLTRSRIPKYSCQMRTWCILLFLLTLATCCTGRPRFFMMDSSEDIKMKTTQAYKRCISDCKTECKRNAACDESYPSNSELDSMCLHGGSSGSWVWESCGKRFFPQKHRDQPAKSKVSFRPEEILQLFENYSS